MLRTLLALTPLLLAACPGDDDTPRNPPRLWLSLVNGDETRVQLSPVEPNPF